MKRQLLFIVLLFLAVTTYSQTERTYKFTWAVSANNYSLYGYGTHVGYRFGPGVEFKKEYSSISYGFDLLFTSKGTSGEEGNVIQKYIHIPANLNFHFPVSERNEVIWTNSLYLAYAFDGESKYTQNGITMRASPFSDDNIWGKKIPRFDLGLTTGFGMVVGRCVLGLNFELGLIPLDTDTYYDEYDEEKIKASLNASVFLSLTVRFWE